MIKKTKSKTKSKSTTNKNTKIINVLTTVKNYYTKQKDGNKHGYSDCINKNRSSTV